MHRGFVIFNGIMFISSQLKSTVLTPALETQNRHHFSK